MPAKETTSQDAFLAAVIKTAKVKIEPDYDALAAATGMSKGGARNKFRAIMRELEAGGAGWAKGEGATKTTVKRKTTAPNKDEAINLLSDSEAEEEKVFQEEKSTKKMTSTAKTEQADTLGIYSEEDGEDVPKKKASGAKTKKSRGT